jgi:nicotinate-nucleotide pyrophosphorylase (carboxylating)
MSRPDPPFAAPEESAARRLITLALEEDAAAADVTTALAVPPEAVAQAHLRARRGGVVAGLPCVGLTLQALGGGVAVEAVRADGDAVEPGDDLLRLRGRLDVLLRTERTFLNLVGSLSGVATLTARYVERAGPGCRVLDTRKTWPGWRVLQKYAVRCGGGGNHRMGLADAILLKDNHHAGGRGVAEIVARARAEHPDLPVIVECDDLAAVREALDLDVDRLLLDNFDPAGVREAVRLREAAGRSVALEVSGGVHLDSVGALAEAGAELVSVGALTHSAPALDVGLDWERS